MTGSVTVEAVSVAALLQGLVVLVALLLALGSIGGVGVLELLIWIVLVCGWISFWNRRRHAAG